MALSRWLRIARSNRPPHLTSRKDGFVGVYSWSVGNSALGTRTFRLTQKPTVGSYEGRASGFTAAGGDDGDDDGATRSGSPRGTRGGPRELRAEILTARGLRNPGRWTTGDRCCPTRSHSRDSSNTWSAGRPHRAQRCPSASRWSGILVKQPRLSIHRPGPGGTCAEGSGLEDFSDSPSICWASVCIS
jgi:hypothetical protein